MKTRFLVARKQIIIIIVGIVLLVAGLYLFFAYNYFYYHLGHVGLNWPNNQETYIVGNSKTGVVYAAIGDSLTSGVGAADFEQSYPYLLANYMSEKGLTVTLKNRSYPGLTTKDVAAQLLDKAISDKPDIITVCIGVNDTRGLIPPPDFRKYYDLIIGRLSKETSAKIYVVNLPYLGAKNTLLPPFNLLYDRNTQDLNKIIEQIAQYYGVVYIDLYGATNNSYKASSAKYSIDGYHPSADGYKDWAQLIANDIN